MNSVARIVRDDPFTDPAFIHWYVRTAPWNPTVNLFRPQTASFSVYARRGASEPHARKLRRGGRVRDAWKYRLGLPAAAGTLGLGAL